MSNIITDDTTPEEIEEMKRRMPPRRADAPPLPPGKKLDVSKIKVLESLEFIDPIKLQNEMRNEDR